MLAYDMMAPFIIPYFIDEYSLEAEDSWGDYDDTGLNLIKHWSKISLQQEILIQRDSYDHFSKMSILLAVNGRWSCL